MTKQEKQIIKMVTNHYDVIYKSCEKISNHFGNNMVPLSSLKVITDKAQIQSELKEFESKFNATLTGLYDVCKNVATDTGVKYVTITFLKQAINTLKTSFIEAAKS